MMGVVTAIFNGVKKKISCCRILFHVLEHCLIVSGSGKPTDSNFETLFHALTRDRILVLFPVRSPMVRPGGLLRQDPSLETPAVYLFRGSYKTKESRICGRRGNLQSIEDP
jgi:hypothetical protein